MRTSSRAVRCLIVGGGFVVVSLLDVATGPDVSMALPQSIVVALAVWAAPRSVGGFAVVTLTIAAMIAVTTVNRSASDLPGSVTAANAALRAGTLMVVGAMSWALRQYVEIVESMASRDAMTGALNRRAFDHALAVELDRAARSGEPVSLAYLDLDELKRVNDEHGHAAGDRHLRDFVAALQELMRPYDVVARIGGDEFAVILPRTGEHDARAVIARLTEDPAIPSASIGVVTDRPGSRSEPSELVARADAAMYEEKQRRRAGFGPSDAAAITD